MIRRLFVLALILLIAFPATALAGGPPLPPQGVFQAPPTPVVAPLPTLTPTPPVAASSQSEGGGVTQVFLPRIGARASTRALHPTSIPAVSTPAAGPTDAPAIVQPRPTVTPVHADPLAASFVYVVKAGDTAGSLAIAFGRDVKTMSCVREADGSAVASLTPGDPVIIPALADLCHQVRANDTLAKIAAWYGVSVDSLLAVPQNQLLPGVEPVAGQFLLIPNARSRYRDPNEVNAPRSTGDSWRFGDGKFIWPIERSQVWVSQSFRHGKHMAIDMATKSGVNVLAADTGAVIEAGWSDNGYGYYIVIDHGIDYITLYAHLGEYYVQKGDIVKKGDVVGVVGSTGNSTGPHLHFEVRDYGYLVDPLLVLPRQ